MESRTLGSAADRRSSILLGVGQTSVFNRFVAKGIDVLLIVAVYFLGEALWRPLGVVAASLFCAWQDGWGEGQSVGKKIIGLRVIEEPEGISCSFRNSLLRNFPFVLGVIFSTVPFLWVFFILLSLPVILLESYLILTLESGVRLGDVLGNTLVVEATDDAPHLDRP